MSISNYHREHVHLPWDYFQLPWEYFQLPWGVFSTPRGSIFKYPGEYFQLQKTVDSGHPFFWKLAFRPDGSLTFEVAKTKNSVSSRREKTFFSKSSVSSRREPTFGTHRRICRIYRIYRICRICRKRCQAPQDSVFF